MQRGKKYRECDNRSSIRLDVLEEVVKDEINTKLAKFYNKTSLEKRYAKNKNIKAKYPDRVKTLELEKSNLEKKRNGTNHYYKNLYEDKLRGIITDEEFLMLKQTYLAELEDSAKRLQVIEEELRLERAITHKKDSTEAIFKKYKKIKELNKIMIDEFIDKIYIGKVNPTTKERDIIIEWKVEGLN